jgi:GT2 family glycosyltransferase
VARVIFPLATSRHGRFEVVTEPRTAADANAILARARTPFLVFVREGGQLTTAGATALDEAIAVGSADLIFGDSRSWSGARFRAPAFSPFRLRSEDYLGPVVAISVDTVRERGGFPAVADGALTLDFALRVRPERVVRLREVLAWGPAFDVRDGDAAERAAGVVHQFLAEQSIEADVRPTRFGRRRVEYRAVASKVSVIIPTRGGSGSIAGSERVFVVEAVRGLLERGSMRDMEIVVVADDATPQKVIDDLERIAGDSLRLVRWSEPFDFSAKMNRGAAVASGEYLLLLNDDVELVDPDSLERMLSIAEQPNVGIVGALLYFEDGSVQHLGHLYQGGGAGHIAFGVTPGAVAPIETLTPTREVSGVTAACAIISAQLFAEVGGFSSRFPGNYNDVDLSMKVREAGRTVLCTGDASFYHFESKTRDARVLPVELGRLQERWGALLQRDEYSREQESSV